MHNKNINFKKCSIPLMLGILSVGGMFLCSYLTFVPEQASAAYDWETRTLADIDTMQQMNAKICENSEIGDTKQLEDTREPGKKYWVTKLRDENCWMTQNLDFDIPATLYPESSDVTAETQTGINGSTAITSWTDISNTANLYHDPGNYYYKIGTTGQNGNCENTSVANCNVQFGSSGDAHYHVGNFYTWNAATVKSKTGVADSSSYDSANNAPSSICPKNWMLPTSNNTNKGSFYYLLNKYNMASALNAGTIQSSSPVDGVTYQIYNSPLYFIYDGYLVSGGKLYSAGFNGYYWSSTLDLDTDYTYSLNFNSGVNSSGRSYRRTGFPVRCVNADVYPEQPLDSNSQANVAITVSPVISIDVTQHVDTQVDFTSVAQSEIRARVGSNQPYQVLLSTEKSALTNGDIEQNIPMVPSDQKIVAGTSSWGIKKLANASDTEVNANTIYSPVGINGNKELFYTSSTAASEDLTFPIAIAVNQQLPQGTYSTQVTLTAVAM